jgi:aromatic ring hydroxylase
MAVADPQQTHYLKTGEEYIKSLQDNREVYYKGDQFVIERAGKPMAAVVPLWQLEEWQKHRRTC